MRKFCCLPDRPAPSGPPGPPAQSLALSSFRADTQALSQPLRKALLALLGELNARATAIEHRLFYDIPQFYWYSPAKQIAFGPPGNPGPPGPPGAPGLPGELWLIQDDRSQPLLESLKMQLGMRSVAASLEALESRAARLRGRGIGGWRIQVLTPEWRAMLDWQRQQALAQPQAPFPGPDDFGLGGCVGLQGPPGARGEDGHAPANAEPVRLTPEQWRQLRTLLSQDKAIQEGLQGLRAQRADLSLWVAEAEHESNSEGKR